MPKEDLAKILNGGEQIQRDFTQYFHMVVAAEHFVWKDKSAVMVIAELEETK